MSKVYFNLNFDDLHPETSNHISDSGGDKEKGVLKWVLKLKEEFPKLKITFYATPNWRYYSGYNGIKYYLRKFLKMKTVKVWEDEPFRLDKHKDWVKWLNKQKFEIAIHGLYHFQEENPQGAEFTSLNYMECIFRLKTAIKIMKNAKLKFVMGFRPPGWGFNKNLLNSLKDLNFKFIGISADVITPITKNALVKETGFKNVSLLEPSLVNNLINIPQNWDVIKNDYKRMEEIAENNGVISAKGHVFRDYGNDFNENGLCEKVYENIRESLNKLLENYDVKFVTNSFIAEKWRKKLRK